MFPASMELESGLFDDYEGVKYRYWPELNYHSTILPPLRPTNADLLPKPQYTPPEPAPTVSMDVSLSCGA